MTRQTGQNMTYSVCVFSEKFRQVKHTVKFHCHITYQFHIYSYVYCPMGPNNSCNGRLVCPDCAVTSCFRLESVHTHGRPYAQCSLYS